MQSYATKALISHRIQAQAEIQRSIAYKNHMAGRALAAINLAQSKLANAVDKDGKYKAEAVVLVDAAKAKLAKARKPVNLKAEYKKVDQGMAKMSQASKDLEA